jgi:predicted alpha/beta-hydrolase family hydrolase
VTLSQTATLRMLALGLFLRWLCAFPDAASAQQEIVTLPTRPGVTQSYFLTSIPKDLRAVAVLFPGSGGLIQLRKENDKIRFSTDNFLVRSRSEFIKRNVVAAILDAPSDQQRNWGMTDEFRRGELHFTDISVVIDDLGKRFSGEPIFLVGTSRGSVSAAALGARFGQEIAGVVLTSSMFRPADKKSSEPGPGLSGFDFSSIKAPTLIVHHVSDQCEVTPYGDAARLSDQFPLITVFGGDGPQSQPCDPYSAHGFFKREGETVEQIVNWMLKKEYREQVK